MGMLLATVGDCQVLFSKSDIKGSIKLCVCIGRPASYGIQKVLSLPALHSKESLHGSFCLPDVKVIVMNVFLSTCILMTFFCVLYRVGPLVLCWCMRMEAIKTLISSILLRLVISKIFHFLKVVIINDCCVLTLKEAFSPTMTWSVDHVRTI